MPDIIIRHWDDEEFFMQIEQNNYKVYCIEVFVKNSPIEFPIFIKSSSENVYFNKVANCKN